MFYTVKIETNTEGVETRDLRQFTTEAAALVRYHSDLAKYIDNTTSILEMIINDSGVVLARTKWVRIVDETDSNGGNDGNDGNVE